MLILKNPELTLERALHHLRKQIILAKEKFDRGTHRFFRGQNGTLSVLTDQY